VPDDNGDDVVVALPPLTLFDESRRPSMRCGSAATGRAALQVVAADDVVPVDVDEFVADGAALVLVDCVDVLAALDVADCASALAPPPPPPPSPNAIVDPTNDDDIVVDADIVFDADSAAIALPSSASETREARLRVGSGGAVALVVVCVIDHTCHAYTHAYTRQPHYARAVPWLAAAAAACCSSGDAPVVTAALRRSHISAFTHAHTHTHMRVPICLVVDHPHLPPQPSPRACLAQQHAITQICVRRPMTQTRCASVCSVWWRLSCCVLQCSR
jgi:hypothetical protein